MKNKYLILLNVVLVLIILIITQYKGLTNKYYVNNDMRVLFYINNFQENLKDNLIAQYSYSKWNGTTIYLSSIYVLINNFVDFILFAKILNIFLFLFSIIFIYKLGKVIKNKKYALILTLFFILFSWTKNKFDGGVSHSFAYPLLIVFLYYLVKKDNIKLSIVMIFQAMLYPPVLLISLGTYGLSLINFKEKRVNLQLRKNIILYISILISFIIILVPMKFITYDIKEKVSFKEAIYSPEFYLGGRHPMFRGTIPFTSDVSSIIKTAISFYDIGLRKPILTDTLFVLILLSLIFTIIYGKKILQLPKDIYLMIISSFLLTFIATIIFPALFFPNRYIKFTIPLFLIILFSHGLYFLSTQKKAKYLFPTFLTILIIFHIPKIDSGLTYCEDQELYEFIKKLPKEALYAGHPSDMDCIALYGQRKPFITYENSFPYYIDYYKIIKQRTYEFFSAYYAEDRLTVHEFCSKNNIDYLIINKEHFTLEYLNRESLYLEPFNAHIKNLTKQKKKFYLIQAKNALFESNDKFVIKCS